MITEYGLTFEPLPRFHRKFEELYGKIITGLIELLKYAKPSTLVEVGSGTGESTEIACQLVGHVWAIDSWSIVDPALPLYQDETVFDRRLARFNNLTKIKAPSLEAADLFEPNTVDMVYIDAIHEYEHVREDLAAWLPKIRKGGFMSGHEYAPWHPGVQQAVNENFGGPAKIFEDYSWIVQL